MIFEEITEDILNEKLITYGNRKPYGQIVFIAGGAGSGKGFAISNFIDSASFKVRDVDEMKKQLQILNRLGKLDINSIIKKYGKNIKPKDIDLINKIQDDGFKLQNLNLKNSDHVYALHILVKAIGIKDASLEKLLLGKNNPETLPNILFDITAKDVTDITSVIPKLKAVGYKPENIHLTWVLTKYVTALENNKNRERKVPDGSMGSENIMLKTHEGASNTIWGLVTKALPKGMNGRVDVILNNPENTVFLKGADGKDVEKRQTSSTTKVVKGIDGKQKTIRTTKSKTVKFTSGFLSLPLKKEKGGIYAEKVWRNKLFNWVKSNAPESITANMKESVNEDKIDVLRKAVQKINRKYKVNVSSHPVTKGEIEIILGSGNHPDSDYHAIEKLVNKLGIKNHSIFNESVNELNLNESVFSAIDLIRQDAKDVRDFVKKVFSDSNFKDMKNDKDFIKYLKSIYEGVSVNEISKFAGWVAIDHKGKRLEIKKSEAKDLYNAKLLAIKKLKVPKSKESMLVIKPGYNESVVNEANLRLNKKVKSELDAYLKGTKINSPEHQHAIMLILKGALTDANFHSEAKQLPKFFPKAKQSKHVGTAMEDVIEDKGAAYSKAAKWDGHDIIDAFSFYTSMTIGGSFGKKLETLKESISESVNEGKKRFYQQDGIGRAKYTISYHDGKSKHKDGSDFYGIQILKNKKDLEKFRNDLLKKGYREDSGFKKESVNEGLKHNDMYTMLDIAAGYSSTQDQAANQMWSDEQDLYDYLKSDHIPKKYHKKFHNDIKRRFKNIKESVVNEITYKLGTQEYTKKNLTPTDILDLAMAYSQVKGKGTTIYGRKMDKMIRVANDLAKLNGTTQQDAKKRGDKPALILTLLKNKLVTKDEYITLYKDLLLKQTSVVKNLKNADPAARMVGGAAARAAHFDMKSESVNEGSVANKWNIQSQDIGKLQKKTSFSSETSMPFSLISNLSGGVNSTDKGIVSGHFNKDVVILQFYPKEDSRNDTMYDAVDKKGIIAIDKLMKKQYGLSMVSPFLLKGKRHCSADGEVCSVSNYLVFGGTNESIEERVNLFLEKNVPTDASKWSYYKSQAKKKFDVYPSAYANGWAAKKYKAAGGGWKTEK